MGPPKAPLRRRRREWLSSVFKRHRTWVVAHLSGPIERCGSFGGDAGAAIIVKGSGLRRRRREWAPKVGFTMDVESEAFMKATRAVSVPMTMGYVAEEQAAVGRFLCLFVMG
jgi:hypothetical protein